MALLAASNARDNYRYLESAENAVGNELVSMPERYRERTIQSSIHDQPKEAM